MKRILHILTESIRNKVIALCCSITFVTILISAGFYFYQFSKSLQEKAIEGLAATAKLTAVNIKSAYDQMENDAFILSRTPPIPGIMRSKKQPGNVDPMGQSNLDLWQGRLETIFSSMIAERPHYTQIRLIGVANNGKELVRVDRTESGIKSIEPNRLQEKGNEIYMSEGLQLAEGDAYFSEVTYNREEGKIDDTLIPTIRVVVPVFEESGEHFGLVVINANYERILQGMMDRISPQLHTLITTDAGDYLHYSPETGASDLEVHNHYTKEVPAIIHEIRSPGTREYATVDDEQASYFARINVNQDDPDSFFGVVLTMSARELFADVRSTFWYTLLVSLGLILSAAIAAGFFANQLTRPLKSMTREIATTDIHDPHLNLPVTHRDEVGALARAFKNLTESLLSSEARANAVLDNTVDGIITIDQQGIVLAYNKACVELFGYEAEEVLGKNIHMLMPDPYQENHDTYIQNYNRTGQAQIIGKSREVEGLRKEGTTFPMYLSVAEIQLGSQRLFTGIIRDITDLKRVERQRELWIEKLADSNKELEQFAYIASHDLQEPLRKIQAYSERLKHYVEQMDEKGRDYFDRLENSVSRMQRLINDLLALSRVSHNNLEWDMVDLSKIAQEAASDLETRIEETCGEVVIEETVIVEADPRQMRQLFQNLIGNALKFHREGVPPRVRVSGQRLDGGVYELYIKDSGIGFDIKYLDRIFKPFERLHGRSEYPGTGIGMAICKKIVDRHEGNITAQSEPGEGTTFIIRLPLRRHHAAVLIS